MIKNSKLYNWLKFTAQIGLPALGSAYFALAGIWGLPSAEQVVGTVVVIDTFLGTILQISTANYNNTQIGEGDIVVKQEGEKTGYILELDGDPADIANKQEVRFKVKP